MGSRSFVAATMLASFLPAAAMAESQIAEPIPRLNPVAYCKVYASGSGVFSRSTFDDCIRSEQRAYDKLKDEWAKAEPGARITCSGPRGTDEAYFALEYCLRTENAAINKPAPRFQY